MFIVATYGRVVTQSNCEGFTDNGANVAAKLEDQNLTNVLLLTAPSNKTPINLCLEALVDNQNNLQTSKVSVNLGAPLAGGLPRYLDSDPMSPDNSPAETVILTLDGEVRLTPCFMYFHIMGVPDTQVNCKVVTAPNTQSKR